MGRLFQYNRFSNKDKIIKGSVAIAAVGGECESKSKKIIKKNVKKSHIMGEVGTNKYQNLMCPAYSNIYPDRCETKSECKQSRISSHFQLQTNPLMATMTTKGMSFPTVKRVEVAFKKYHQWSSKFLPNGNGEETEIEDCSQISLSSSTSGFYSCRTSDDSEMLTGTTSTATTMAPSAKKCKVYECMKDFLRRKLFHQEQQQKQQQQQRTSTATTAVQQDEATSDYDEEVDLLESSLSYNADDDDDDDDKSDDDETCCCADNSTGIDNDDDDEECLLTLGQDSSCSVTNCCTNERFLSESNSLSGSLNCFQYTHNDNDDDTDCWDDSDAGISDCCQLLSDKSPKRRQKNTHSSDEETELNESPWYLPNITTKLALAQLANENPGKFIIRQCGKGGSYSLYLRLETKVKKIPIIRSARCYKLKGAKKEFSSLKALVTHHSLMAEQLPLTLTLPRPLELQSKSKRYLDDFDTFESLQLLGILQLLQEQEAE